MGVAKFIGPTVYFDDAVIKNRVFSRQDCINAFNQGGKLGHGTVGRLVDSGTYEVSQASALTLKLDARLGNRYIIANSVDRNANLTIEGLKGSEVFHGSYSNNNAHTEIVANRTKLLMQSACNAGDFVELIGMDDHFLVIIARSSETNGIGVAA